MTSPWAAPPTDHRGDAPVEGHGDETALVPGRDAQAAGLTAVVLVLLGAPTGLLWAAVAPRVRFQLGQGGGVRGGLDALIGADAAFGLVVLLVGLVCGVVAFLLGSAHGPGVVVGLLVGGLVAAYVAAQTGEQVGLQAFQAATEDLTRRDVVEAGVRLRATETLVLWPVGALAAFGGAFAAAGPGRRVSSG